MNVMIGSCSRVVHVITLQCTSASTRGLVRLRSTIQLNRTRNKQNNFSLLLLKRNFSPNFYLQSGVDIACMETITEATKEVDFFL